MKEFPTPPAALTGLLDPALPHQRAVVGILAAAGHHRIDPVPLLRGLAAELPGRYAMPIQVLAERIADGMNPVDAILGTGRETPEKSGAPAAAPPAMTDELETSAFNPRLLPPTIVLAMRLAHSRNAWPAFCRAVLERAPVAGSAGSMEQESWVARHLKLLTTFGFVASVFSFFLITILPEFDKMLDEFGIAFPRPLALLAWIGVIFARNWWIMPFLLVGAAWWNRSAIRAWVRRFSPLSWQRVEVPRPVLRQRALALLVEHAPANQPVSDWKSLNQRRIISRGDAEALSLSQNPETQAWLLRWSAGHRLHRLQTRAAVWGRSFLATAYTVLGLLVFLVCISVMSVLITLVAELSQW